MTIEVGTKYQIAHGIKGYFNSAETLTIIRHSGVTVQFSLGDGKGHGSMPVQHLHYLLKKSDLTKIINKRILLENDNQEEEIS